MDILRIAKAKGMYVQMEGGGAGKMHGFDYPLIFFFIPRVS